MASLDFSKFNFTAEQIRDVRDLIWDEIVKAPEFSQLFSIYPNVVAGKEVGYIGKGGLIIKKDTGCGQAASEWTIGTRKITWQPQAWKAYVEECYADLQNTAAVYAMNKGVNVADLTDTDYMTIVVEVFGESLKQSIFAIAIFGDTQSADGTISLLDGFKKQMDTQVTANPSQAVALESTNIVADFVKLIQAAKPVLRADATGKVYATQKVYDALINGLVSANASTAAYAALVDGTTARILGVEVIALPLLDELAAQVGKTANFAFYSAPKYLGVAVDSEAFGEVKVFFDEKSEVTGMRGYGKLDVKLTNPEMFVLGTLA